MELCTVFFDSRVLVAPNFKRSCKQEDEGDLHPFSGIKMPCIDSYKNCKNEKQKACHVAKDCDFLFHTGCFFRVSPWQSAVNLAKERFDLPNIIISQTLDFGVQYVHKFLCIRN